MVAVAVAVPFGVAQFELSTLAQVNDGGIAVLLMVAIHVAVQFAEISSVTVTVYVPFDFPLIDELVSPELQM